jgi:hypothetical protein
MYGTGTDSFTNRHPLRQRDRNAVRIDIGEYAASENGGAEFRRSLSAVEGVRLLCAVQLSPISVFIHHLPQVAPRVRRWLPDPWGGRRRA